MRHNLQKKLKKIKIKKPASHQIQLLFWLRRNCKNNKNLNNKNKEKLGNMNFSKKELEKSNNKKRENNNKKNKD